MGTPLKGLPTSFLESTNASPFLVGDNFDPFDASAPPFAPFADAVSSAGPSAANAAVSAAVAPAATLQPGAVASLRVASPGGSGLVFNDSFDSSCSAPFEACVVSAEKTLEGLFTNPVVFNVSFTEQNQGNTGDAASNSPGSTFVVTTFPYPLPGQINYQKFKSALPSSDVLPSSPPGGDLVVSEAYARMLGLTSATESTDATVTLNSSLNWSYGQDVANAVIHELSEYLMGRVGGLGDPGNVLGLDGLRSVMDLFRYAAGGTSPDGSDGRDGKTTYFSADGGKTISQSAGLSFNNEYNSSGNQVNQGDTADFTEQAVFGYVQTGETLTLTQTELNIMEALGWKAQITQDCFTASSGNWQTATDWSSSVNEGATPIEPQDAYIGANYAEIAATATSFDDIIVNSIGANAVSKLIIGGGSTFTATNGSVFNASDTGTTASGNDGAIIVEEASRLLAGGIFANAGALTVEGVHSSASFGGLLLNSGAISVDVGASVTLSGAVRNSGAMTLGAQIIGSAGNGELLLSGATTLTGGGAINLGAITVGFTTDIATHGGGNGGGGGHVVTYQTSGEILGGGALVNMDNTISGAGFINVGSLDNRSVTGIGATMAGAALQIESATLSNEGEMFANAQTTLALGLVVGTTTLANSGRIDLAAGADLEVSDSFTALGSGSIDFNGAGAALTSEGLLATTFTNSNAIVAAASSQIGDVGIKAANDLSLINKGSITAKGAGVTLTLNTGANTIVDRGGHIEAESGAQLTIDSAVETGQFVPPGTPTPTQSTIEAASGGVVNVNAAIFDGVTLASQLNGEIVINGGTVNVAAGVSLLVPVSFVGAGGVLNLASAPSDVDVSGAGGVINLTKANADVAGGGFTVNETGTDWLSIGGAGVGGAMDVVNGSGDTTTTHASSNVTIAGSHDTVDVGVTNALSLEGGSDVLNLRELFGETTVSGFAATDVMAFSSADFANFQALLGHTTQSGADALITLDAHDQIELKNVAASSLTASQFQFV